MKYRLVKNNNRKSTGYNKYYAKKVPGKILTLEQVSNHMAGHNTSFSKGQILGLLTDMVECIRELCAEGNSVKIGDMGIFQVNIKSKGVFDPNDFNAAKHIAARFRCRATGTSRNSLVGITRSGGAMVEWEEDDNYNSPRTQETEPQP